MKITAAQIKEIMVSEFDESIDVEAIGISDSIQDAGVDSLDRSSLFLAIEDTFEVEISDDEVESLDSIESIISFIERKK